MSAPALDAFATAALIDAGRLVEALAVAAIEYDDGAIVCPERLVMPMVDDALLLSMPAVARDVAIHKSITVAPRNAARGWPTILGTVTVLDPASGKVRLVLDGPTVTGLRTAAISLLAIQRFANLPVDDVLVIGTGVQARHHVRAIAACHPQARVRVRGTSRESTERFCAALDLPALAPAAEGDASSIVITCTDSPTPVYAEAARADRLVIAVGSFRPTVAEIHRDTVLGSALFVDDPRGAPHEAGDFVMADVDWSHVTSLADALRRTGGPPAGPVLFKSVGCAAWDLAAARVALQAMA